VISACSQLKPVHENSGGSIRIADSTNFRQSKTVAAALVVVKPGSMRELHWHPNADEWQYYMQGSARMTVFNTGPHANTTDFRAVTSAWSAATSATTSRTPATNDLIFIETFRSDHYEEVSLANWLSHLPPKLVSAHLKHPRGNPREVPARRAGNRAAALAACAGRQYRTLLPADVPGRPAHRAVAEPG